MNARIGTPAAARRGALIESCFSPGTPVLVPTGAVPIESLSAGDLVLAFDLAAGVEVVRAVKALHHSVVRETRSLFLDDGTALHGVTPSHPFWVVGRADYVSLRDLALGDVLLVNEARQVKQAAVVSISVEERHAPTLPVWNLTVSGREENYFAGGVLVHNKSFARRVP